ncbi:MAG: hypothetical protein HRU19_28760 [Pseudobacteriovorax sp.]|nr:hypothetical protein [Pseudobacteriovorax sp.]
MNKLILTGLMAVSPMAFSAPEDGLLNRIKGTVYFYEDTQLAFDIFKTELKADGTCSIGTPLGTRSCDWFIADRTVNINLSTPFTRTYIDYIEVPVGDDIGFEEVEVLESISSYTIKLDSLQGLRASWELTFETVNSYPERDDLEPRVDTNVRSNLRAKAERALRRFRPDGLTALSIPTRLQDFDGVSSSAAIIDIQQNGIAKVLAGPNQQTSATWFQDRGAFKLSPEPGVVVNYKALDRRQGSLVPVVMEYITADETYIMKGNSTEVDFGLFNTGLAKDQWVGDWQIPGVDDFRYKFLEEGGIILENEDTDSIDLLLLWTVNQNRVEARLLFSDNGEPFTTVEDAKTCLNEDNTVNTEICRLLRQRRYYPLQKNGDEIVVLREIIVDFGDDTEEIYYTLHSLQRI